MLMGMANLFEHADSYTILRTWAHTDEKTVLMTLVSGSGEILTHSMSIDMFETMAKAMRYDVTAMGNARVMDDEGPL